MDPNILGTGPMQMQQFFGAGTYVWTKPKNCRLIYIIAVAGGGSGSSGTVANTWMWGGGGGGAGGNATLMIPGMFAPECLKIVVGAGGATSPSVPGNAGSPTTITAMSLNNSSVATALLTCPGGNGARTATTGALAPSAATVDSAIAGFMVTDTAAGILGGSYGDTSGSSGNRTAQGSLLNGGHGGAFGNNSANKGGRIFCFGGNTTNIGPQYLYGGNYISDGSLPDIPFDRQILKLPMFFGGLGGGGVTAGNGQSGSKGAPGGGGGGGAGAITGNTAGSGGAGGDGFVWILTW
jgi:hypothetical protein